MAGRKAPDPFTPSRDSTTVTHRLSVPDPNHIGLPRAKRGYTLPILIALAVFAVFVGVRLLWG